MDQYFTNSETALECWNILQEFLALNHFPKTVCYIEPSAGSGSFFKLLPKKHRIGFELDSQICSKYPEYKHQDFLTVKKINTRTKTKIAIGNPPFTDGNGHNIGRKRSMQTLFIQKCEALGCDVIAFIVGASMHRIRPNNPIQHMVIARSEFMPQTNFTNAAGKSKIYNVYFDIYIRGNPERYIALDDIRKLDFGWKLVSPNPKTHIDLCFVRWGANVGTLVDVSKVRNSEYKKLLNYHASQTAFTSSRYFFIQIFEPSQQTEKLWTEFLENIIKPYIYSVSTTTSSSLGIYELLYLWNQYG
jgi:hypothetical protein